jgi:hypothetical protein
MLVLGTKGYGFKSRYSEMKKELKAKSEKKYSGLYWIPNNVKNIEGFNDYQYIKFKLLFELLIGTTTQLNKNYGYIINYSP